MDPLIEPVLNLVNNPLINKLIQVVVAIIITIVLARTVDGILKEYFKNASAKLRVDETSYAIIRRIAIAIIYIIGILFIISLVPELESVSLTLFASAGFAAIVIGLAAQSALSNIISGIFLAIFRPFRVGDVVTIKDEYGKVTDITLRHTVITTWENKRLIIPNSVISDETIINWTIEDLTVLWHVDFGISYDSDIDLARKIILEEARKHPDVMSYEEISKHRPDMKRGEELVVRVTELGDFAVNLRLLFWARDRPTAYPTGCDLLETVKKRFDKEGVEIPFPYRTVVFKKDFTSA
ncbi:MAG TPA: mechanosensitive ion channel family protein [Methanosarcinales archaeon]|nr:mechanosensitive ion channel family protein [Methanosarcinales archaeon]